MSEGIRVILPQLILGFAGLALFCAGAFRGKRRGVGFLFSLAVAAAAGSGFAALLDAGGADFMGLVDGGLYARFFTVLIALVTLLSLLFARRYALLKGFDVDEFHGVLVFAALGMELVASALNWVIFFLGIELLSISLYILIAIRRGNAFGSEAAVKYFVTGSVASGFLTFGMGVIYAVTGTLDIAGSLGSALASGNLTGLLLGMAFLLVGIGFKISLAPFHLWTPDVYQGAPAPVVAFLSTGSKVAVLSFLLRLSLSVSDGVWVKLVPVLWGVSALTMVAGNVTALVQTHVKRILAYSSVAQMGYIVMALLAVRQDGGAAVVFYTAVYALMDLGAFGTVAVFSEARPGAGDLDALDDYRGLGLVRPFGGAVLGISLLSLAGLPPTAGFMGKFALFEATLRSGYIALAVLGIVTAIVSIYFYLRVLVTLFMKNESTPGTEMERGSLPAKVAGCAVLAGLLWFGLFPSALFELISRVLAA